MCPPVASSFLQMCALAALSSPEPQCGCGHTHPPGELPSMEPFHTPCAVSFSIDGHSGVATGGSMASGDMAGASGARSASRGSNNPGGRDSVEVGMNKLKEGNIERGMLYVCGGRGMCPGLDVDPSLHGGLDRIQRINDIKSLRLKFTGRAGTTTPQAILDELWEHTPDRCTPINVTEMDWRVGTQRVCHWCWAAAAGLLCEGSSHRKKSAWEIALAAYNKEKVVLPASNRSSTEGKSGNTGTKMGTAIAWINEHCQGEQGWTQQTTVDDAEHLQGITKVKLYKEMNQELGMRSGKSDHRAMCYAWFTKAVKKVNELAKAGVEGMVEIKFDPWCTQGECAVCVALKVLRRRAMAKGDEKEKRWCEKVLETHNLVARLERLCYHIRIERAVVRHKTWGFAVDGYCCRKSAVMRCQGHNISDMKGAPGLGDAETVKYKTTGVLAHGFGYFLYIADPTLPSNANLNVEVVYRTLQYMLEILNDPLDDRITVPPDELLLQIDGASDNRALVFFMFCELLIRLGLFDLLKVTFLIVGHTHNDIDQKFAPITKTLRTETITSVGDLIAAYWEAYPEDKPTEISRITAVSDWTQWLVAGYGMPFAGCSRRTPDENRPHQYLLHADGNGGSRCDYKNLAIDDTLWNTDGIQLLSEMPDPTKLQMQKPNLQHITKLAATRTGVMANFKLNNVIPGSIPAQHEEDMVRLFDQFCDVDGNGAIELHLPRLEAIMANNYQFKMLERPAVVVPDEIAVPEHQRPPVEPITHSKFTATQRDKALAEVRKEAEEQAAKEAETEALHTGAALERGAKHLSKKAVASLQKYQAKLNAEVHGRKTNAIPVFESSIKGAAIDRMGRRKFLIDLGGDIADLKWVQAMQADTDTLDDRLLHEEVVVWWNDGTTTGTPTPYEAKICNYEDDQGMHQVKYDVDNDSELFNLETLEVKPLGNASVIMTASDHGQRVMWMVKSYKGAPHRMFDWPC